MSIEEKIIDIISKQTKKDLTHYHADYDLTKDETIDSIDHMEIIMAIEEHYKIGIEDCEMGQNPKISDLVKLVESKLG